VAVRQTIAGWTNAPLIRLRHIRSGRAPRPLTPPRPRRPSSPFSTIPPSHGYRAAYSAVYDRTDYASAIEQLKALGHDDHPNVANLVGYSQARRLQAFASLVRARSESRSEPCADLAVLWSVADRQGNRDQAQYHIGSRRFAGRAARSIGRWPPD
jgi:hypothetical protein